MWTARQLCDDLKGLQELLSTAFPTKNFKTILIRAHVTKCCSLALYFLYPLLQWICWYYSWYTYPYMAIYIYVISHPKNSSHKRTMTIAVTPYIRCKKQSIVLGCITNFVWVDFHEHLFNYSIILTKRAKIYNRTVVKKPVVICEQENSC